jgi:two-component system response regulator PilR (NtrC family)
VKQRLLVIDDEDSLLEMLCLFLTEQDYDVNRARSAEQARERLAADNYDLVLCDIMMPDGNGLQILKEIKADRPQTAVIMMTAYPSDQAAVEAMKIGAYNYVAKPFNLDELAVQVAGALEKTGLEAENVYLRRELEQKYQFSNIVGKSAKMRDIFALIERVARTLSTVLIQGESGTGKELIARAIHYSSPRAAQRFQSINCGAMPENLLESELFGHEKGAFTGAVREKKGLFHEADKGTLFLDEISEMTPTMQVKLLRALQDKRIRRVGGNREEPVDVRIIAATNRDLRAAIDDGSFREDLYYRINVIPIELPPLRQRREDIPLLVDFFIRKYGEELGVETLSISREALQTLESYAWPGNVRELENTVERALALSTSEHLTIHDLPLQIRRGDRPPLDVSELPEKGLDLEEHLDEIRSHLMQQALDRTDGVQTQAAELLGMTFRSFRYYAKKLGLTGGGTDDDDDGAQREPIET